MTNPSPTAYMKSAITIVGTGPVGMFAALKLANHFDEILLIGPEVNFNDFRTTALMMPAIKQFDEIGIWKTLSVNAAPLVTMKIIDKRKHVISSPSVTFHSSEIDEQAFGFNIPNTALNSSLHDAVTACQNIKHHHHKVIDYQYVSDKVILTLDNHEKIETQLLVAADGRNSSARKAANIKTKNWSYPQTAIILSFSHTLPHNNTSTEFHTHEGPFTQVPLLGNRSSLVWVQKNEHAERVLNMTSDELAIEIEEKMEFMLGKIKIEAPIQAWPVAGIVPHFFARNRTILVGEAAHVFPPIGAQGLNLGIRDVVDLVKVSITNKNDLGNARVINDYNRRRKPDIWARTGFVHLLNKTLLSDFLPIQMVRSSSLELLRQFSPLRKLFMNEVMEPGHDFSFLRHSFNFDKIIRKK